VAADAAVGLDVEYVHLAAGVQREVGVQGEPGQPVDALPRGPVGAGRGRVAGRGAQRRRVVEVDEPVGGEAGVDADALQAFFVMVVNGQRPGHPGGAGGVGAAQCAVPGGVQDRAVRQHREGHRLAHLGDALGQGDLLEVGRVDGVGGGRHGHGQ
jgi:hypothetical protein